MRSDVARFLIAGVTGCGLCPSQNVTVPASLNGVEGGGGTNIPFGSNLACRYQCIYDAEELPWAGPRVITGILLRADNNAPLSAIPAKGFLDVSVLMSTTDKNSATASATFADNYGSDATWVISHQLMQLPAQPLLPAGPRPANIPFVFTVPWAYGLTPASPGLPAPANLLVEIWIHSQPAGLYRIDNLSGCVAPTTTFGLLGPLCVVPTVPPAPPPVPVALTTDTSMLAGSSFAWHIANAPPSVPFLVTLNLTNTGGLFGQAAWPLPYPMFDPMNPSQPSAALAPLLWSAPDCWLNLDPVTALGGSTDTAGVGSAVGFLPPGRQFVGTTFYAQAIVLSPTSNALRFITSLGRSSTICGPLGVARNFSFYNTASTPPAPTPTSGSVQVGVGLVFEVQ